MAETKRYGPKGMLRSDCMKLPDTLADFPAVESDWRELFRWTLSVSGDLPYFDREDRACGTLASLWENHVLTVLAEILRKEFGSYLASFVAGRGTSAQEVYTKDLETKFSEWAGRLRAFLRQCRSDRPESPSAEVAEQLLDRLEKARPQARPQQPQHRRGGAPDEENRPYFRMLGAVEDIQRHGGEYLARIEEGGDLDPALALLLVFVRNYGDLAARFNRRFGEWAACYRKNILNDTPKAAVPDEAILLVEPDREKGPAHFALPAGTQFLAGKNADGTERIYATAEKEQFVRARVRSLRALTSDDGRVYVRAVGEGAPGADRPLFATGHPAAVPLEYGWLLASRSFHLSEGRRTVTIRFDLEPANGRPDLAPLAGDTGSFRLQISGSAGWNALDYSLFCGPEARSLQFRFTLEEGVEAPAACSEAVHGIATVCPAVRLLFAGGRRAELLSGERIGAIRIRTEVAGIRRFTLVCESGPADPAQPFYPFGVLGERGGRFLFGHGEAAAKEIVAATLEGVWSRLPEGGFAPIYANYPAKRPIGDGSFAVRCERQTDGGWLPCADSLQPLFRREADGCLSDRARFVFEAAPPAAAGNGLPDRPKSRGFYRAVLDAPEIGFGMKRYYTLFSETMLHNARVKEKRRRPLPEMPQVPLLTDATFGYRSEERLSPENGCLYRLTGTGGCEACSGEAPLFLPDAKAPALLVEIEVPDGTNRLRLYVVLRDVAAGGMPAAEQPDCRLRIECYAGGGCWRTCLPEEILCEETAGFTRSGFIELQLQKPPAAGLLQLRCSFEGGAKPEEMVLEGLFTNCFRVRAVGGDGSSLPAGTPLAPLRPDDRIRAVALLRSGFGGRPAETEETAAVRCRIRMATRNRALCGSDYERLLLAHFPEVEKVCCLPACDGEPAVRLLVFPKPEAKRYPFLPGWKRAEMERLLRRHASPFATIEVVNPVYEPLSVRFRAMLKRDARDPGEVKRRTERRIRVFFMAWYLDGTLPDPGVRYSCKALLSRIGNDAELERVESLRVEREAGPWPPSSDGDTHYEAADRGGILYVREIVVELVPYRPGVERAEIGADFSIG